MTEPDPLEAMRQVAREVLREVVPEILADADADAGASRSHNGHAHPVPRVPPPPVGAVLRPSTWTGPAVPGEVIGDGVAAPGQPETTTQPAPEPALAPDPHAEPVTIDTDEDLARFVRALLARLESPRDRRAIRSGRVRFTLRRATATARGAGAAAGQQQATLRIPKGAVTERIVRDAAARGVKLVLARGAVLTPLARDQARALGVEIEKEGRC